MLAVFRADGSSTIGGGHMMRCLALANALADAGWDCGFACNEEAIAMGPALRRHEVLTVPVGDSQIELLKKNWPKPWQLAVVDHYGLGSAFEGAIRGLARRVLAIDDQSNRAHDCDILLDQTLDRAEQEYRPLTPPGCKLLLGPAYALLRPEFAEARVGRMKRKTNSRLTRIVVGFGLSDPHNLTFKAMSAIQETGLDLSVDVIVGNGSPFLPELQSKAESMKQTVNIWVDPVNIAELLSNADLAIGGAGVSAWERCCVGLPTLMGILAENQRDVAMAVERRGAAILLEKPKDFLISDIARGILKVASRPAWLAEASKAALQVCDGRGTLRTLMALLPPELTATGSRISLRFVDDEDAPLMLSWQADARTRRFSRNPVPPTPREHQAWVSQTLADPSRFLTIILCDDQPAGALRLDRLDRRDPEGMEISILVAPDMRGKGIATAALRMAHKIWPQMRIVAEVLAGNTASQALFSRAGYRMRAQTIYVREPLGRGNV